LRKLLIATAAAALVGGSAFAIAQITGGVPQAQPRIGTQPNMLADGFTETPVAIGSDLLENPQPQHTTYGYINDNDTNLLARTRTEADQNEFLHTTSNPGGPAAGFDYGRNFLIQGHENGGSKAYFTRINLDVPRDDPHRITNLTKAAPGGTDFDGSGTTDPIGFTGINRIDGVVFDPFNEVLLYTSEDGTAGRVIQQPLNWSGTTIPLDPAQIDDLDGSMGRASYEGVVPDSEGNVYLVEDEGGANVNDGGSTSHGVRQPFSFVYRFVPDDPSDLTSGELQALQISDGGTVMRFHDPTTDPTGARNDALGPEIRDLHSGISLTAHWVTIHDTATDGTASFDANALAKNPQILGTHPGAFGTPLKRPENGKFVPGRDFRSYVFTETGDTSATAGNYVSPVDGARASDRASWGALMKIDMPSAGSDDATVKAVEVGDAAHAAPDNVEFLDADTILAAEDRGDTLHNQLNLLDSLWSFDLTQPLGGINEDAQRLIAQGRDSEALNNQLTDNEVTGIDVSDGSTAVEGIRGTTDPAELSGVRIFYTQQHGKNRTFEITPISEAGPPQGSPGLAGPQGSSGTVPQGSSGGVKGKSCKGKKAKHRAKQSAAKKKCRRR
jgi:hypothetical protein